MAAAPLPMPASWRHWRCIGFQRHGQVPGSWVTVSGDHVTIGSAISVPCSRSSCCRCGGRCCGLFSGCRNLGCRDIRRRNKFRCRDVPHDVFIGWDIDGRVDGEACHRPSTRGRRWGTSRGRSVWRWGGHVGTLASAAAAAHSLARMLLDSGSSCTALGRKTAAFRWPGSHLAGTATRWLQGRRLERRPGSREARRPGCGRRCGPQNRRARCCRRHLCSGRRRKGLLLGLLLHVRNNHNCLLRLRPLLRFRDRHLYRRLLLRLLLLPLLPLLLFLVFLHAGFLLPLFVLSILALRPFSCRLHLHLGTPLLRHLTFCSLRLADRCSLWRLQDLHLFDKILLCGSCRHRLLLLPLKRLRRCKFATHLWLG
mmetsp:Transcript_47965/g.121791  ORF Transcript_47965/g.121791 Transcript_47965/m.121791 type:complete len:368 (-) Transcript_47965:290-1393(-)